MAITEFSDGARQYFRITRSWNNQSHQRYVRIKRSRESAYKSAQKIDADLAQRQRAYYHRLNLKSHGVLHQDGKIIGVSIVKVVRSGRADAWVFKMRVAQPDPKNPQFTTVSISKYGFDDAFERMVEAYTQRAGLDEKPSLVEVLKGTRKLYRRQFQEMSEQAEQSAAEEAVAKKLEAKPVKRSAAAELESRLRHEIQRFASRLTGRKKRATAD